MTLNEDYTLNRGRPALPSPEELARIREFFLKSQRIPQREVSHLGSVFKQIVSELAAIGSECESAEFYEELIRSMLLMRYILVSFEGEPLERGNEEQLLGSGLVSDPAIAKAICLLDRLRDFESDVSWLSAGVRTGEASK